MQNIEIKKIISAIDQKIKSLENTKRVLIEEFGGIGDNTQTPTSVAQKETRKEVVRKLLEEKGPLPRKEILEITGIPIGTLAYVLNDKKMFYNKDAKWGVVSKEIEEEKKPGFIDPQ